MKQILLLTLLCLTFASCGKKSSQKDKVDPLQAQETPSGKVFKSTIRPNEKIRLGQVYLDEFEFVTFVSEGEYNVMKVRKENKNHLLVYPSTLAGIENLHCGDFIETNWKIDTLLPQKNNTEIKYVEQIVNVTSRKDGKFSVYKKTHTTPIHYTYDPEAGYTTEFLDKVYNAIEFYVAFSANEFIVDAIRNHSSTLTYSIEELRRDGNPYYLIGISTEAGENPTVIQWVYIDANKDISIENLLEYDLANEKLIKFEPHGN